MHLILNMFSNNSSTVTITVTVDFDIRTSLLAVAHRADEV